MANRVVIGEKNGRHGVWISPPGVDAMSETARLLVDSDLDNLKPYLSHRQNAINQGPWDTGDPSQGYIGVPSQSTISFGETLPFRPLTFVSVTTRLSNYRLSFPPGTNWDGGSAFMYNPFFEIYQDRIEILSNPVFQMWDPQCYIYTNVFANPIEGA